MDIDRAIDILDKWEFFHGQRAGRELWAEKPREVQEQDIANFCRDLGVVREALERQRWIPCSERLPGEKQRVLFWVPSNEAIYAGFYNYTGKRGTAWFRAGKSDYASKYWMPLPEPPEEENKNAAD